MSKMSFSVHILTVTDALLKCYGVNEKDIFSLFGQYSYHQYSGIIVTKS